MRGSLDDQKAALLAVVRMVPACNIEVALVWRIRAQGENIEIQGEGEKEVEMKTQLNQ